MAPSGGRKVNSESGSASLTRAVVKVVVWTRSTSPPPPGWVPCTCVLSRSTTERPRSIQYSVGEYSAPGLGGRSYSAATRSHSTGVPFASSVRVPTQRALLSARVIP